MHSCLLGEIDLGVSMGLQEGVWLAKAGYQVHMQALAMYQQRNCSVRQACHSHAGCTRSVYPVHWGLVTTVHTCYRYVFCSCVHSIHVHEIG